MSVESRPLDEAALVTSAQAGDLVAYAELVRIHQQALVRVAMVVSGSATDAEDIAQEALVKAYLAIHRFNPERPFRPWLMRIVRNEALNRRRGTGRRTRFELRAGTAASAVGAAPSPEATVIAQDEKANLLAAVDDLPSTQREVVACRYLIGLSEDETARALGIARGTVKSRTSRGLAALRRALQPTREKVQ